MLTVVDQYTREALATEARGSFSAHDVIEVLNRLSMSHQKPAVIQVDKVHIESFNTRLGAHCLNAHVFESLDDAEETSTSWRSGCNVVRPHGALGMLAPREAAELGHRNAGR